ncbi:MAG TPA: methyltransferase domain-containing protein [Methylomirabilota bacterium]|jgi:SAM-dependent methyltransferase|nr:methyltransferase domain-containing protein [Methylomirabilota bacterium]
MRRAEGVRELLDGPVAPADLAASLDDLDRLNAWFGGYALTLARVRHAAAALPRDRALVVVDVGGGRGDFARRLVRLARRDGWRVAVVVVDRDPATVAFAGAACAAYPEISVVRADVTALPLREAAADVATASLTLHHLEPDDAVSALAEMAFAARRVIVNDLLRTRASLALVWLVTRVLAMHPMSRHDGPLSVRRAYTADELGALAEKARIAPLRIRRHPLLGRLVAETP